MNVFKSVKVWILVICLILGAILLIGKGLNYGLDFSGGTQFILTLSEPVNDASSMEKITSTIAQRMDWSGLKDVKVNSWDQRFVSVQIAESDQKKVAQIEELLQKQGKFECIFEGKILFTGDDVLSVVKSADKGYSVSKDGSWALPFKLNSKAARNFSEGVFHKCVSLPDGTSQCPATYFFIDRPLDSLVLISKETYDNDKVSSDNVKLDDVLKNSQVHYLVVDTLDENTISKIKSILSENKLEKIIYMPTFDISKLTDLNLNVKYLDVPQVNEQSWVWSALGLKTVINLTEGITNKSAPTVDSAKFSVFMDLYIQGKASNLEGAQKETNELSAILSSGSLPVGIENISKETVSPTLGQNILSKILILGLLALAAVALVIFIRYKDWRLALPIFLTGSAEVFLTIAFASLINWQLDLAALAGILAAVGTGVDDQIIITDELERNKGKAEQETNTSLLSRVKRAFFIIWMSAATLTITMLPIIFVFGGVPKLVGFALTTLIGVGIGVFITRPAYAIIIKEILANKND